MRPSRLTAKRGAIVAAVLVLAVAGAAIGLGWYPGPDSRSAGAVPTSAEALALGAVRYREHCAACHGADLEGQPSWRTRKPDGRLPAPPHDDSGHTWHHPDEVLFRITKEGTSAVVPGYESDMPGFQAVLTDDEIRVVLTYIKSRWSARSREFQAAVNERAAAARSR